MTDTTAPPTRTRRPTLRALIIATGLLATLLAPIGAAADDSAEIVPRPPSQGYFELTIVPASNSVIARSTATARLSCGPAAGIADTHPHPRAACRQLAAVDGHISRIPPVRDVMCTMEYAPVVVTAKGIWNGEPRTYENRFSNRCVAVQATGGYVFAF